MRPDMEESSQVGIRLPLQVWLVGIEPSKEQRSGRRLRVSGAKPTNFGFLKNVISTEHLIRPFPREDYLVAMLSNQFRQNIKRCGSRSEDRFFRVPDDGGENVTDVFAAATHFLMICLEEVGDFTLVTAFIELCVVKRY